MKKTILFALIALMFLALVTGCRAYRRTTPTTPGYEITNTDGRTTTQGFHYRHDGYVGRSYPQAGSATHSYHGRHHRHDGLVTDRDGIIGNGTHADRPADDYNPIRRPTDGVGITGEGVTRGTNRTLESRQAADTMRGT